MLDALGLNLKEIIFAVVDFLILAAVLGKFLYKPFLGALEARKNAIAAYVYKHDLPVKVYKDYGWPAVEIPKVYATTEN